MVVTNAIAYIRQLEKLRMPEDVEKKIRYVKIVRSHLNSSKLTGFHCTFRLVKRQNRKLRSLIREEIGLAEAVSEAQLVQMGLKEIRELIAEAKRKKKNRWEQSKQP